MWSIVYFRTSAGRSQALEFLRTLEAEDRAQVLTDIEMLATHGGKAPVSTKPIKGHRPMWEIRTGGYRALYCLQGQMLWILHICKKQDQIRGIVAAYERLKQVLGA